MGEENTINKSVRGMLTRTTQVCARLKILAVLALGLLANLKKAVSIPNMNTMFTNATKAYSLVIAPYSANEKMFVCGVSKKKFSILGRILPKP
jgi:preprotein translocase subunit SecG